MTKFSLFHHTKEFQSRSEDSIGEEAEVIAMVLKTGTEKEPEKKLITGFLVEPMVEPMMS